MLGGYLQQLVVDLILGVFFIAMVVVSALMGFKLLLWAGFLGVSALVASCVLGGISHDNGVELWSAEFKIAENGLLEEVINWLNRTNLFIMVTSLVLLLCSV